jgi:hypothetical protein
MLILVVLGAGVFERAYQSKVLILKDSAKTGEAGPAFNRFAYSVDAFVPLVNLKQREAFVYVRPTEDSGAGRYLWFQIYFWVHTALGWVLTTLGAAGLSGLVKKE